MPSKKGGSRVVAFLPGKRKGTYRLIYEGGAMALGEEAATEIPLYPGKVLSEAELRKLKGLAASEKAYEKALSCLARGSYSEHALLEKLMNGKDIRPKEAREAVKRLKEASLLDDRRYAEEAFENASLRLIGRRKVAQELKDAAVDPSLLTGLDTEREDETCREALRAIEPRLSSLPLKKKREKAYEALLRRGFEEHCILSSLEDLDEDKEKVAASLRRDALLVYQRMARKYNGRELLYAVYQALIRKGYRADEARKEINQLANAAHQGY